MPTPDSARSQTCHSLHEEQPLPQTPQALWSTLPPSSAAAMAAAATTTTTTAATSALLVAADRVRIVAMQSITALVTNDQIRLDSADAGDNHPFLFLSQLYITFASDTLSYSKLRHQSRTLRFSSYAGARPSSCTAPAVSSGHRKLKRSER
eukprot:1568163-Pleurochrysis_carterae.AAC.1